MKVQPKAELCYKEKCTDIYGQHELCTCYLHVPPLFHGTFITYRKIHCLIGRFMFNRHTIYSSLISSNFCFFSVRHFLIVSLHCIIRIIEWRYVRLPCRMLEWKEIQILSLWGELYSGCRQACQKFRMLVLSMRYHY